MRINCWLKKVQIYRKCWPSVVSFCFLFLSGLYFLILFFHFSKFLRYYFSIGIKNCLAGIIPKWHTNTKCEANKHLLVNCATISMAKLFLIVDILGVNLQNHRHMQVYNYALEYMWKHATKGWTMRKKTIEKRERVVGKTGLCRHWRL